MVGVGRDLCGSPSPTPCPSRVTHSRLHSTAARGAGISPEKETPRLCLLGRNAAGHRGAGEVLPRADVCSPFPTQDGDAEKKDPFEESGLSLSPTAAEAKEKVRAKRVKKRAPQMDWNKKREIFSNF